MPFRIRKDIFLHSVALPSDGQCRCQRREMVVSTNNGLVNGPVHNLLMQFFTLGSSKIEVLKTCFFDTIITWNDHPRYVTHVLGTIYMSYLGIVRTGGVFPRD